MRASLITALTVMGLLCVLMVLAGGRLWQDFVLDGQRAMISDQARTWIVNLRKEFETGSREVAMLARSDAELRAAVRKPNKPVAGRQLSKLSQNLFVKTGASDMVALQLLAEDFHPIAAVPEQTPDVEAGNASCQNLRAQAERRMGADHLKSVGGLCIVGRDVRYIVIQPLGEDSRDGYLQINYDMLRNFAAAEADLAGLSVRLSQADGTVLFKSAGWPKTDKDNDHRLMVEQALNINVPAKSLLNVAVSKDMAPTYADLAQTERMVTLIAAAVMVLAVLILWMALRKITVNPLQALVVQLRRLRSDKSHFGEHVMTTGNTELAELGAGFNNMSTRLKELYDSLESLAFTDPLTKLPNRTLFHERLEQAIEEAKRDYRPFALLLMDLDRFKDINDTLGHQVGDLLLQQVAARLRSKLRDIDTVARMGGDEFAILLPAVSDKHATMAARMLLQALRAPFRIEEQSLDIGASIGVALYPDHGVDANILIQRADVAMYSAKNANSGHAFYDSKLDQHNPTRLTLLGELRHAVEQEQFVLYYQPKVNLKTLQVTGVEALVRWNHPREDLLLPDTFIPLLEQTGMIRSLTPWVLNESLRQGQMLQDKGVPITISMNLSVRDLQDPYLADAFAEQLAALQISPRWLELEITESAVMTEPERALEVLTRLSSMGLRIAIDDFGTGYSSLSYLKKLPVNTIKIDKSFVIGMVRDENDAAIVRTSVDLAHNLKLEVVAEGVENEATLNRLSELGCDTAQGHYISRPLSAEELAQWLQQSSWGLAKRHPKLIRLHN
ncbi:MAG: EAL domain-containing protein [Gammaproteobacteria bacterium]|nr:EAL domain-containing protein [Gammaproteobacteria bacterium]